MPTARELLEQADALMRRNRSAAVDDIPVLTDSVAPQVESRMARRAPVADMRSPADAPTGDAIPTLTERAAPDLVDESDSVLQEGEPSDWLDLDGGEPSITGDAPDSIAIVPPVTIDRTPDAELIESAEHEEIELTTPVEEAFDEEIREIAAETPPAVVPEPEPEPEPELETIPVAPAPPPPPAAVPVDDDARWEAIAEEIRMQVLQRIDLFTDTGLREQLGRRLQPIVDRASADLVATINLHVGELLRAYVAEAIEREIDSWRKNH